MSKIEDSAYLLWFYSNCSNDSFIGSSFIATCQDVPARFVFISDRYLGTAMPTITSWWVIYEPCENQSHNTWRRKNAIFQFARNIHLWLSFSIWVQLLSMVYTLTPTFWIGMNVSILEDCLFIMLNSMLGFIAYHPWCFSVVRTKVSMWWSHVMWARFFPWTNQFIKVYNVFMHCPKTVMRRQHDGEMDDSNERSNVGDWKSLFWEISCDHEGQENLKCHLIT